MAYSLMKRGCLRRQPLYLRTADRLVTADYLTTGMMTMLRYLTPV
jgi:hypothetical protein